MEIISFSTNILVLIKCFRGVTCVLSLAFFNFHISFEYKYMLLGFKCSTCVHFRTESLQPAEQPLNDHTVITGWSLFLLSSSFELGAVFTDQHNEMVDAGG